MKIVIKGEDEDKEEVLAPPLLTELDPGDDPEDVYENMVATYSHVVPKMTNITELKIFDNEKLEMEEEWFDYIEVKNNITEENKEGDRYFLLPSQSESKQEFYFF